MPVDPVESRPRILIAEDEPGIADTLCYVLRADGHEPVWCATAGEALAQFRAQPPALAILDVGLPDLNGFALFRQLQALPGAASVPMLFLTARSDEIDRVLGLELGADDYIAKPFSPRELVARVRTILRRSARSVHGSGSEGPGHQAMTAAAPAAGQAPGPASTPASAPAHGSGSASAPPPARASGMAGAAGGAAPVFHIDGERRQIRYHGRALDLSRYEYGLLALLVQRPGRVYTRDELLDMVWDDAAQSLDRTVDAHVKTLRAKLKAIAPGVEPIRTLRGIGYALHENLPPLAP